MGKFTMFLMTRKGFTVLQKIIDSGFIDLVDCIIVGNDKNIKNDYADEIIALSKKNNLDWYLRKEAPEANSQYSMAISWRWMIRNDRSKLIVLHDSLLPKYRGFAPLINQLINGEPKIGVTALFASPEYDKGPIIDQLSMPVEYPIKIEEAIEKISVLYGQLANRIFEAVNEGSSLKAKEQEESEATYSLWRDEEDYKIDWSLDSGSIIRHINAVGFPYAGAKTDFNGKTVRILDAETCPDVKIEIRQPGKIIYFKDEKPVVVCGNGLIRIKNAIYDDGSSIFPLKQFRIRFK